MVIFYSIFVALPEKIRRTKLPNVFGSVCFFFLCELKLQIIMLPSFGHFGPWTIFCVRLFEKMVRSAKTTHFSGASGCGRSSWPRTPAC
jgi:hypothetical protein